MIDKDEVIELLEQNSFPVCEERRYKNIAWRLVLESGTAVYLYDKHGFYCQGKQGDQIRLLLEQKIIEPPNSKVFVVYGHDVQAKDQLKNLLAGWGLEPLFLDALPSEGRTIVEKLEKYIPRANYGIVLLTPDDLGYARGHSEHARPRARQNVILELGMLYMKMGRSRTAIIRKLTGDELELPSDIGGVMELRYTSDVAEVSEALRRELKQAGYAVG